MFTALNRLDTISSDIRNSLLDVLIKNRNKPKHITTLSSIDNLKSVLCVRLSEMSFRGVQSANISRAFYKPCLVSDVAKESKTTKMTYLSQESNTVYYLFDCPVYSVKATIAVRHNKKYAVYLVKLS